MIETRDGESKVVNNTDIYNAEKIQTAHETRIDVYYGANNYIYIRGNSYIYD